MKICEYIHNLTDIKYVLVLILNKSVPKKIETSNYLGEYHDMYFLLQVDSLYSDEIHTTLKVKTRNIKYPYFVLADILSRPHIWEAKTARIGISKKIKLIFGLG